MNLLDIAILSDTRKNKDVERIERAAERIRQYEAGYRDGHRIGHADALLCDPSHLAFHAGDPAIPYREGYEAGYRKGWESTR